MNPTPALFNWRIKRVYRCSVTVFSRIRTGFEAWVVQYEKLYYQYDLDRLSACPLTVHALLHIADGIKAMGPVWAYWAFPIERFCGKLGKAIKSRRNPYTNLDNRLLLMVQMMQIKNMYGLHDTLRLGPSKRKDMAVEIPNPLYKNYMLVHPRQKEPTIPSGTMAKLIAALATRYSPPHGRCLKVGSVRPLIKNAPIEVWGKLQRLEGGDLMHASTVVAKRANDRREASFVRYEVYTDVNARHRKRRPNFQLETFYGELQCLYRINVPATPVLGLEQPEVVVLAAIRRCKITRQLPRLDIHCFQDFGEIDIVDAATVQCLVARLFWRKEWFVFDRSGTLGRTEPEPVEQI